MEAYATVNELEAYWKTLDSADEKARAGVLLDMASNYLRQIGKNNNVDMNALVAEDDILKESVKSTVLAAVKRAMSTPIDAPPADQWSQSASPYSETMRLTNPSSDLYFKKSELQLIGLPSISGRSQFGLLRGVR